jgi:hypothetical protein
LAALGAFGYNFFGPGRDKKAGERRADVEYRGTDRQPAESVASAAAPAASLAPQIQRPVASFDDGDIGRFADVGSNFNEIGQPYYPVGSLAAGAPAPATTYRPRPRPFFVNDDSQRRANAAADAMYENRPSAGGRTGVDPAALEGFGVNEVGRGRAPVSRVNASARQYNQDSQGNRAGTQADGGPPITEEMRRNPVARIPGQDARAPEDGRRVTGGDISRNLANIAAAMGPTRLAGFGNAAIEGATARGALQRAAALRAERAEAGRRGQTPTNFSSSSSSTTTRANRATKKTKKFDEDTENVEFKRGGKAMSKTKNMASGGMSSASKRGDGIATKGKTKCKMY